MPSFSLFLLKCPDAKPLPQEIALGSPGRAVFQGGLVSEKGPFSLLYDSSIFKMKNFRKGEICKLQESKKETVLVSVSLVGTKYPISLV